MFKDGELDFVVASHVLEHMPDIKSALREWVRVLKVGGILAVVVPDGEIRPHTIKGSHKIALTKEQLKIVLETCLRMRIVRVENVVKRDPRKASIIGVAKKRR